jgi:hypothetical protein
MWHKLAWCLTLHKFVELEAIDCKILVAFWNNHLLHPVQVDDVSVATRKIASNTSSRQLSPERQAAGGNSPITNHFPDDRPVVVLFFPFFSR